MKKTYFLLSLLFSGLLLNAQNNPIKPIPTINRPTVNISQNVEKNKIPNGSALIYTEPGNFKLYATYANSKVTEYYAIDGNGKRIPATYTAESRVKCIVCILGVGDK